jgi:hypothetical protein
MSGGALKGSRRHTRVIDGVKYVQLVQRCEICWAEPEKQALARDHDHETGQFRGYLCMHCNTGLGHFKDDPELLRDAARYLEERAETSVPAAGRSSVPTKKRRAV